MGRSHEQVKHSQLFGQTARLSPLILRGRQVRMRGKPPGLPSVRVKGGPGRLAARFARPQQQQERTRENVPGRGGGRVGCAVQEGEEAEADLCVRLCLLAGRVRRLFAFTLARRGRWADQITIYLGSEHLGYTYQQCCRSGYSLIWLSWIRIRNGNVECGSRSMEIEQN